jgi:hypothetical protein
MLDDLQERGKIILVGSATAGHTAVLAELKGHPGWRTIVGEIQLSIPRAKRPNRSAELSIVGVGVQPEVRVQADSKTELFAWQRVESGESPVTLLRTTASSGAGHSGSGGKNVERSAESSYAPRNGAQDVALRRAHDILVALQVMGEVAPSVSSPRPTPIQTPQVPLSSSPDSTIPVAQPDPPSPPKPVSLP